MERYDSLANLKDCLAQTGIYTLDGTTLVDVELSAYAAGLELALDAYEELLGELFVETAETYGLSCWENALGCSFSHVSLAKRRKMLLGQLAVSENDYTVSCLEQALDSVGIVATITEQPAEQAITVVVTDAVRVVEKTQAAVRTLAELVLPAHLSVRYDFTSVPYLQADA